MLMMSLAGGPAWPLLLALLGRRMGGAWLAGWLPFAPRGCVHHRPTTDDRTDRSMNDDELLPLAHSRSPTLPEPWFIKSVTKQGSIGN
jgi:hypothetical protein